MRFVRALVWAPVWLLAIACLPVALLLMLPMLFWPGPKNLATTPKRHDARDKHCCPRCTGMHAMSLSGRG